MGLGQLVNFDTAFAHGLPDAVAENIGVVSVMRADTDADSFDEWVVFYLFDKRARNSPIHGAVYDNDRGKPPVIFPYQLQAPDRNYLSEQQIFGPSLTIEELATDRNGPDGADVPELIVQGANELTVFRFRQNSEPWDFPRDTPARYQAIGFFRGSGAVNINLNQDSAAYGQVTVIDRNGFERSQLAIRSVFGLVRDPTTADPSRGYLGDQTYLDPVPPLGGVGGPQLAAPILSTVDFYPAPPDELFNTPFPEKLVLGFYAATCGTADGTLCNTNTINSSLLWRPDADTPLSNFLAGDALAAFNANNPGYFGLPAFDGNSGITVAQLRYYPQMETDPDLLETGGGRDVVTGEQGQVGCVQITFNVNGSALQEALYQMQLTSGTWKILRRLEASCAQPVSLVQCPTLSIDATKEPEDDPATEVYSFSVSGNAPVNSRYEWNFGDGTSGEGQAVQHRYNVSLDNGGAQAATPSVRVLDSNGVPLVDARGIPCPAATVSVPLLCFSILTADANGPYSGSTCNGPVTLTGNGTDSCNRPLTFTWDFGDGSPPTNGQSVTHDYTEPRSYTATLTVTNDRGQSAQDTAPVTINPPPAPPPSPCGPPSCCG